MKRALLLAFGVLTACSPQPRAVSYFRAHLDEAERVTAACRTGAHRGAECANADVAIAQDRGAARIAEYRKSF